MAPTLILARFAKEEDLLEAVRAVQKRGWEVVDVFTPYPIHGLEELLGWRRSWLPAACLLGGAAGAGSALWFQFWASAQSWPINVGGRPWNSLPAFVPVAFESMVLLAGFGLVGAWLLRCGLYPGKKVRTPLTGVTDDRFALAVRRPAGARAGDHAATAGGYRERNGGRRRAGRVCPGPRADAGVSRTDGGRTERGGAGVMKGNRWVNPILFVALLGVGALCYVVPPRDVGRPNYEFLPEAQMARSPAYDSFAPNPNFDGGPTLRTPPAGAIRAGPCRCTICRPSKTRCGPARS